MATPTDPDMPAASLLLSHAPDTGILSCPPRFLSPCHGSSCNVMSQVPGAHNDVRAEGKGRSVQRPRKRLKFENVLTVVLLLFLVRTSIVSLTDDSASKAAKIVVRHKIVSVRAEGYASQQSSTPEKLKGKFFCRVETSPEVLAVKQLDQLRCCTALLKVFHHVLPLLHYKWCPGTLFSLSHPL